MSSLPFSCKKFVGIEYPAVVKNVDRMLESLGGEKKISETYADPSRRLEMKFRSVDPFSKPALADRTSTTNLLMRVRRIKKDSKALVEGEDEYTYEAEILGIVDTTYKFQSMIDFQYLPMEKKPTGNYQSILEKVIPLKLESKSWCKEQAPLFPIPPLFSRMDTPIEYQFRKDPVHKKGFTEVKAPNIINQNRLRRIAHAQLVSVTEEDICLLSLKPHPNAVEQVNSKLYPKDTLEKIKQLFQERPIWSKNALLARSGIRRDKLKTILPIFAYYFTSGPWRGLWCRFGYDPRQNPESKIYQVLDFRVRQSTLSKKSWIKPKRSAFNYNLPNKVTQIGGRVATIQREMLGTSDVKNKEQPAAQSSLESAYRFRKEVLPPYRQLFYQFCDIEIEDIQKIVNEPEVQKQTYDNQHGWFDSSVGDKCRSILSSSVSLLMKQFEGENKPQEDPTISDDSEIEDEAADETLDNDVEADIIDLLEQTDTLKIQETSCT